MSLEEDIAACFPAWMSGVVGEPMQAIVLLIREREKLFVEQVGRLNRRGKESPGFIHGEELPPPAGALT